MVAGSQTSPLIFVCCMAKRVPFWMLATRPPPILKAFDEVAFDADEHVVLLVDPGRSGQVADDVFGAVAGFGLGIAGEVDGDGVAAVELNAARVGEGAEFQQA